MAIGGIRVALALLAFLQVLTFATRAEGDLSPVVSTEDMGSDPAGASGAEISEKREVAYSFQCESCRALVRNVIRSRTTSGEISPEVCHSVGRTSTMSRKRWPLSRLKSMCASFLSSDKGSEVVKRLTPYEVCKRMGHCGTPEERMQVRGTAYNSRPTQVIRRATRSLPKPKSPEEIRKEVEAARKKAQEEWLPKATSLKPATGKPGTHIVVTGKGFDKGSACVFDRVASPKSVYVSSTELKCEVPHRESDGAVKVQVIGRTPKGDTHLSEPLDFTVTNVIKK